MLIVLENSSSLLNLARESGCTVIHAPISFEAGHDEIADTAYGILANVKEGSAFTRGEWGADFSGTLQCGGFSSLSLEDFHLLIPMVITTIIPSHNLTFRRVHRAPAKMMPQKGDLIVKGKSGLCSFASKFSFKYLTSKSHHHNGFSIIGNHRYHKSFF